MGNEPPSPPFIYTYVQDLHNQRVARPAMRARALLRSSTQPACQLNPAHLAASEILGASAALGASGSTTFQVSDNRRARGEGSTHALVP